MRKIIGYEGALWNDCWYFHPGAIRMTKDVVPLTMGFAHDAQVGMASEFQRNEWSGELSIQLDFFPHVQLDIDWEWFEPSIFVSPFKDETHDGIREILDGNIKAISIVPIAGIPRGNLAL